MRIKKGSFMYYQLNMQNSRCICRFFSKQHIFTYGVNCFFKKLSSSLILANSFSESDSIMYIIHIYIYRIKLMFVMTTLINKCTG